MPADGPTAQLLSWHQGHLDEPKAGLPGLCTELPPHEQAQNYIPYVRLHGQNLAKADLHRCFSNHGKRAPFLLKKNNQTKKGPSSELREIFSIWFFISVLGEPAGTTDFSRYSNFAADILICTRDVADFSKRKILFEVKEQNTMALFTVLCTTSTVELQFSPGASLSSRGTQRSNKVRSAALNQLPRQCLALS